MSMNMLQYTADDKVITAIQEQPQSPAWVRLLNNNTFRVTMFWVYFAVVLLASYGFAWFLGGPIIGSAIFGFAFLPLTLLTLFTLWLVSRAGLNFITRLHAVTWGGLGATTGTFIIIDLQNMLFGASTEMDSIVVQAAVVEEFAKGVFLLMLFYVYRESIRTPLTGAVLGILVGAGFAYIENMLYFNRAFNSGGWEPLLSTVWLRAGQSFFLHSLATMFTGLMIGYVVSRNFGRFKSFMFICVGLLAAMTTHGLWNGFSSLTTEGDKWYLLYFAFWLPYVAVMFTVLVVLRILEWRKYHSLLEELAGSNVIRWDDLNWFRSRKTRRVLYRSHKTRDVIRWEQAAQLTAYWSAHATWLMGRKALWKQKRVLGSEQQSMKETAYLMDNPLL